MKRESLEWKVGVFVFLALAALTFLVVRAGDFYMKPGYAVEIWFDSVQGIDNGTPVKLAGVKIGEVVAINAVRNNEGQTRALVTARIENDVEIEIDSEVRITSSGLLGERYVDILPGKPGSPAIKPGSFMEGYPPVGLQKITEGGSRLIDKFQLTADSINSVVADPEFKAAVKSTFDKASGTFGNAEVMTKNLNEASADLKEAANSAKIILARLRDGEGTVGRLLTDDTIAKDLEAFVKEIKAHPWKLLKRE